MVGLGAERPHWTVGGIAHAVVRYHFPVVGGAVFGLCELVGSGCAAIRAVHHVELAVLLAYVNLVAFGKLSLTPFELHIFDKHIGLALLWSLHFATGGHAFAAIQVGKQHAVDEIGGPFVNACFRRIGYSRVFEAQAQVVGVVLREVDFHIDEGVSLSVVAHPQAVGVRFATIGRCPHREVVVRHFFTGEHAVVGEHKLLGAVGLAQVEAWSFEIAVGETCTAVCALVAFNGVNTGGEVGGFPACWWELLAFEEFERVAIGHCLLVGYHMERNVAAIGVEHHITFGR